jgi:hypothetical protein
MNNMTTKLVACCGNVSEFLRLSKPVAFNRKCMEKSADCVSMNKHKINLPFGVVNVKSTVIPGFSFVVCFNMIGLV